MWFSWGSQTWRLPLTTGVTQAVIQNEIPIPQASTNIWFIDVHVAPVELIRSFPGIDIWILELLNGDMKAWQSHLVYYVERKFVSEANENSNSRDGQGKEKSLMDIL